VQSTDIIQNAGQEAKNVVLVLHKGSVVKYKLSQRQTRRERWMERRSGHSSGTCNTRSPVTTPI